uniref:TATA-box binding protein n=1 Tax=viral metagenome TaxID=1070528 RepID=A0A6C0F5L5_9ZZZZ|tara:strand:- start:14713 stop:15531 length:819 start_codon:yes stop_codon:yes gene_type:complete
MSNCFDEYIELIKCSIKAKEKISTMTYVNISTMTIIAQLDQEIDISILNSNFSTTGYPICTIIPAKEHHEYNLTARGKKKKSFYNQTTIRFVDHTTKSIKIFSNGKLQITGVTSPLEAEDICKIICTIINKIPFCTCNKIDLISYKIAMINTNFCYNVGIDIKELKKLLTKLPNIQVSFDSDRYPGLNIKHKNSDDTYTSILFFTTGSVVITGVKSFKGINEAFTIITDIISKNFDKLKTNLKVNSPKTKKNILSKHNGYYKKDLRCAGIKC